MKTSEKPQFVALSIDLPAGACNDLREIAANEGLSPSAMAVRLLLLGLQVRQFVAQSGAKRDRNYGGLQ